MATPRAYTYDPAGEVLTTTDPGATSPRTATTTRTPAASAPHRRPRGAAEAERPCTRPPPRPPRPTLRARPLPLPTSRAARPSSPDHPGATRHHILRRAGDLASVDLRTRIGAGYSTPANISVTYNPDGSRGHDDRRHRDNHLLVRRHGRPHLSSPRRPGRGPGSSNATTSYPLLHDRQHWTPSAYPSYGSYSSPKVTYAYDATGAMASAIDWLGNTVNLRPRRRRQHTNQDNDVSTGSPMGPALPPGPTDDNGTTTAATTASPDLWRGGDRHPVLLRHGRVPQSRRSVDLARAPATPATCSGQDHGPRTIATTRPARSSTKGAWPRARARQPRLRRLGRPDHLSEHDSAGTVGHLHPSYDVAGEVTSQTPITGTAGATTSYTYDTLGDQIQASGIYRRQLHLQRRRPVGTGLFHAQCHGWLPLQRRGTRGGGHDQEHLNGQRPSRWSHA